MSNSPESVQISEHEDGVELTVKVVPASSRNRIMGVWNKALRVAVAAPPEGGKANQKVVRLLAEAFDIKRGQVAITHGQTQPLKRVRVTGLSAKQVRELVRQTLAGPGSILPPQ
jgi:uncharacterized protein (TIGR00251 family)